MITKQPEELTYAEIKKNIQELLDANLIRKSALLSIYRIMMNLL